MKRPEWRGISGAAYGGRERIDAADGSLIPCREGTAAGQIPRNAGMLQVDRRSASRQQKAAGEGDPPGESVAAKRCVMAVAVPCPCDAQRVVEAGNTKAFRGWDAQRISGRVDVKRVLARIELDVNREKRNQAVDRKQQFLERTGECELRVISKLAGNHRPKPDFPVSSVVLDCGSGAASHSQALNIRRRFKLETQSTRDRRDGYEQIRAAADHGT